MADKERYVSLVTPVVSLQPDRRFPSWEKRMSPGVRKASQTCNTWDGLCPLSVVPLLSTSSCTHRKAWTISLMYRFLFVIFKVYFYYYKLLYLTLHCFLYFVAKLNILTLLIPSWLVTSVEKLETTTIYRLPMHLYRWHLCILFYIKLTNKIF